VRRDKEAGGRRFEAIDTLALYLLIVTKINARSAWQRRTGRGGRGRLRQRRACCCEWIDWRQMTRIERSPALQLRRLPKNERLKGLELHMAAADTRHLLRLRTMTTATQRACGAKQIVWVKQCCCRRWLRMKPGGGAAGVARHKRPDDA
jgi:hypothetical protein